MSKRREHKDEREHGSREQEQEMPLEQADRPGHGRRQARPERTNVECGGERLPPALAREPESIAATD